MSSSLGSRLLQRAKVPRPETVLEWVEGHVVDPSAGEGLVRLDPYQREPLSAMDNPEYEAVVLMFPPRVGKSSLYLDYLAYCGAQKPAPATACFATDDDVREFLEERFEPVVRRIPELAEQLDRRQAKAAGRYRFRDWFLKYQGSYAPISATTARVAIGDELNDWATVVTSAKDRRAARAKRVDNVRNLEMRTQTYSRRGRMTILVSSPTDGSRIELEWDNASRGLWHVRCLQCGELSPSNVWSWKLSGGGYAGLQFARDDAGVVVRDSIRWICPLCGRAHAESEAQALNDAGAYLHQSPGHRRRSYTAGVLCCPRAFPWVQVAEAIADAKHSLAARIKLANHYAGQPFLERSSVDLEAIAPLRSRVAPLELDKLAGIVVAVDRQGYEAANYWCCDTWGVDGNGNMRHIAYQVLGQTEEVLALAQRETGGLRPIVVLIDSGGFSKSGLPDVSGHPGVWFYKGDTQTKYEGLPVKRSEVEGERLILANAQYYKVDLLSRLYGAEREQEQLFFGALDGDDYYAQIASMRPIQGAAGDVFQNYQPKGRHDWFDTAKMALVAVDFAALGCPWRTSWRHAGVCPPFVLRRAKENLKRMGR